MSTSRLFGGRLLFFVLSGGAVALASAAGCGGADDDLFSSEATTGTGATGASSSSTAGPGPGGGPGSGGQGGAGAQGGEGGVGAQGGSGGAPPGCGNGVVENSEECDGAAHNNKTCVDFGFSNPAGLACKENCTLDSGGCAATCDGTKLEPGEQCDGDRFMGLTCVDFGYSAPDGLDCVACVPDASGCLATCGDQKAEPGETCDGADLGGQSCTNFGYVDPQGLACTNGCQDLDPSGCVAACNGTLEPGEACDGANLDGHSCLEFGFGSPGGLACTQCTLDPSGCAAVCGNGLIEPGEACDDSNTVSGDGCSDVCQYEGTTCANAIPVNVDLGPSLTVTGTTVGGGQHSSLGCVADAPDRIYAVTSGSDGFFTASLTRPGTAYDSVLYARYDCADASSLVLCANSFDSIGPSLLTGGEVLSFPVKAGQTVFVFVDGVTASGDYELVLDLSTGFDCFDPVPIPIEPGSPMTLIGSTPAMGNDAQSTTCGGGFAADVVYRVTRSVTGPLALYLDPAQTPYDSVLFARPACTSNANSICDHQVGNGGESIAIASVTGLDPLYAWIDGFNGAEGPYALVLTP